jgi:hypothetical protein
MKIRPVTKTRWKYSERGQTRYARNKPEDVKSEKVPFSEVLAKMNKYNQIINEVRDENSKGMV